MTSNQESNPASFYASPQEARHARPEEFLYLACLHEGTGVDEPDFLAVVDAEDGPDRARDADAERRRRAASLRLEPLQLGLPRARSLASDRARASARRGSTSLNVADDPRRPRIEKVIEPQELVEKTGYTRPHTVHCMPGDNIVVSMLGDADGNGACGFAVLDARTFEVKGRWENGGPTPSLGYDFWYQPRKNVLVSSEFGEPNAYEPGFDIEDVGAGRYGQRLHFWNLAERRLEQTLDLGEQGLIPLELRWLHDPEADQGFVGATLASNILRFHRTNGSFQAEPVIEVDNEELEGWPLPGGVPGLITDLVVSMDDRFLYFSNWLHGDLRQYDISDPANPRLTGRLWLGGLLGKPNDAGRELNGGPQMIQLSLDGRRLYVTNSLYSTWDNQFYPGLRSWLLRVNCSPEAGWRSTPTSSSTSTTAPTVPRAPTRCASRAATARPRSSNDRPPRRRHPTRGDARTLRPGAPAGRRGGIGEPERSPPPHQPAPPRTRPGSHTTARCWSRPTRPGTRRSRSGSPSASMKP